MINYFGALIICLATATMIGLNSTLIYVRNEWFSVHIFSHMLSIVYAISHILKINFWLIVVGLCLIIFGLRRLVKNDHSLNLIVISNILSSINLMALALYPQSIPKIIMPDLFANTYVDVYVSIILSMVLLWFYWVFYHRFMMISIYPPITFMIKPNSRWLISTWDLLLSLTTLTITKFFGSFFAEISIFFSSGLLFIYLYDGHFNFKKNLLRTLILSYSISLISLAIKIVTNLKYHLCYVITACIIYLGCLLYKWLSYSLARVKRVTYL